MKTKRTPLNRPANPKRIRKTLIISYLIITLIAVAGISVPVLLLSSNALKSKVSSLLHTYTSQLVQNTDTYLSDYESQILLLYADPAALNYNPDDASISDQTRSTTEAKIDDTLQRIRLMNNYSELFLVSPENYLIGAPSLRTQTLYGSRIYETFCSALENSGNTSVWVPVVSEDNETRLYYVRELNSHMLLVASIYARDFINVFAAPANFSDTRVRLITDDHTIVYSTTSDDIGQPLPEEIAKQIGLHPNSAVFYSDYLISEADCSQGFKIVCSVATSEILSDVSTLCKFTICLAVLLIAIAVLVSLHLSISITKPLGIAMDNLHLRAEYDQLTNLLDKKTFEEHVNLHLQSMSVESSCSYLLIDLDNFKTINDTCGHAIGDEVLSSVGALLNSTFRKEDIKGRIGGDEFAVLLCADGKSPEKLHEITRESCIRLFSSMKYLSNTISEKTGVQDLTVSASVGVAVFGHDGSSFEELYKCADKALYVSKRTGKNRFTFYDTI